MTLSKGSTGAIAIIAAMSQSLMAGPITCANLVDLVGEVRQELGEPFGRPWGQDFLGAWVAGDADYRFRMEGSDAVEARLLCAPDGLFHRFESSVAWSGQPDPSDWMLAQTPADIIAIAVNDLELGPDFADALHNAFERYGHDVGFGESVVQINDIYEAVVLFQTAGTLQIITYGVGRSEIE